MHLHVEQSLLPSIKESLRVDLPQTRPTHRLEAMARSCGFQSYASLTSAMKFGPVAVAVDDAVYCYELGVPFSADSHRSTRFASRAISRARLRRVLDEHVDLTERGFDSIWQGQDEELRKPKNERIALLADRRRSAYNSDWSADQFELALIFLSRQKRIKSLNRQTGSYGLKHRAENLSRTFKLFPGLGDYVSNGMFLAAAYAAGFSVVRSGPNSLNGYINISMETVKSARGWSRTSKDEDATIVRALYAGTPGMSLAPHDTMP